MKFGSVALDQAIGSILAHSVAVPSGRIRKGSVLERSHIEQLRESGLENVTVAQLEAGDVEENEAARRLGAALLDGCDGVAASTATTGRVNLIAQSAGVAVLDEAKLCALNAINPMISFASVPLHHQMHGKAMLGTVKIISYGVPERDLDEACTQARGAVQLARPLGLSATLVITQIKEGADESKGIAATKARLDALDTSLIETVICVHETSALTKAIRAANGDAVLILTGSATSDPQDVAPSAVIDAGGTITRFGMPVDPGNLLFLGALDDKPIIGLPGCARAPALNGADKVLSRVLCGVPTSSADIAAMGVGGLLKEIPTRPQPRLG